MKFTIKKFIGFSLLLVAVIGVIIFKPFVLQAEVTQATRDYLHAQALSDWVVMGLAATGENNFNLDYLVQANPQSATDYSRSILAITAANQNPMTVANRDWLTGLRGFFNNNQFGSIQLINDDIWAVLALHAAGTANDDNQLVAAKNFILANQNQEGGWSYRIGLGSDSNNTAAALMALAATGLGVNDQAVSRGLRYLRDMQGVDGGFPYQAGSDSDGASTAWVMAGLQSLNQDLAAWTREGHTAASFLQTLVLANGSYRWQLGDQEGDLITTAYAAVALSNHFYPVRLWQNPNQPQPAPQVSLRIESPSSTICQMTVSATSVLAALLNGAETCGYTVHITNSALGSYVSGINNWQAGGTEGWSYRVNWQYSRLSADQQAVQQNDQVLWFFGNGDDQLLRLNLDKATGAVGDIFTAIVETFNDNAWMPASGTRVIFGNQIMVTNAQGRAQWTAQGTGQIKVVAEGAGLVRSNSQIIIVGGSGNGVSQTVNLQVDLAEPTGGGSLAFQVAQADLGFGSLRPGQTQNRPTVITNVGGSVIRLTAQVGGDQFLVNNLKLNDQSAANWYLDLAPSQTVTVTIQLTVPGNSLERGHKSGQLIYWGQIR